MTHGRPWFADGLRFECTGCGACCRGHGLVDVSDADIARLAEGLCLDAGAFRERYTRPLRKGRVALVDQDRGDCVFFDRDARGCTVYAHRPEQCRSYPFWPAVLHSAESWSSELEQCEGIGRGPLHDEQAVRRLMDGDRGPLSTPSLAALPPRGARPRPTQSARPASSTSMKPSRE